MSGYAHVQLGSKTVLTPLKWDVCITPESRHRSATLPIAMSSSATVERSSLTSTSPPRCIALMTRLSGGGSDAGAPDDPCREQITPSVRGPSATGHFLTSAFEVRS